MLRTLKSNRCYLIVYILDGKNNIICGIYFIQKTILWQQTFESFHNLEGPRRSPSVEEQNSLNFHLTYFMDFKYGGYIVRAATCRKTKKQATFIWHWPTNILIMGLYTKLGRSRINHLFLDCETMLSIVCIFTYSPGNSFILLSKIPYMKTLF